MTQVPLCPTDEPPSPPVYVQSVMCKGLFEVVVRYGDLFLPLHSLPRPPPPPPAITNTFVVEMEVKPPPDPA